MSAYLSTAKAAALLTRVQLNPRISTDNQNYVTDLIQRAAEDLVAECRLPRYPEAAKGYALSALGASEDISGISDTQLLVVVNGYEATLTLTLAGLTTGSAIASHLQTLIRAVSGGATNYGFSEVTVTHAGTGATSQYTVTSGRYGENSSISFGFDDAQSGVAYNLGLSKHYGGTEVPGSYAREEADDAVVAMTEILYRKLGLEGAQSGGVPGDGSFSMYADELSPAIMRKIKGMRRFWRGNL